MQSSLIKFIILIRINKKNNKTKTKFSNKTESREDIYKHLNHKFFFIMIYFGKKWGVLVVGAF